MRMLAYLRHAITACNKPCRRKFCFYGGIQMPDLSRYTTPLSIWTGICLYIKDHPGLYAGLLSPGYSEDDLLKAIKKQAREALSPGEYDTFRKAITALRKSTAVSVKKENLYRLLFVLRLNSDTEAQNLLMNYLHQSELSARSLDEFIIISALKLRLSWQSACDIRTRYKTLITTQPLAPDEIAEGQTAEVYYSIICERIKSAEDLCEYLDCPENIAFFAKTCNTQYLALFDDVQLETLYNGDNEKIVRMYTNYGTLERERIKDYYFSLYGLPENEVLALTGIFENVFMSYDNFCLLVQRKRPVNVSSGTFLLGLIKKLLSEDADASEDFYVNFLDPEEFRETVNDILIYFGFPVLDPDLDTFDRLVMDTYNECLSSHADVSNASFQQLFLTSLRNTLRELAYLQR